VKKSREREGMEERESESITFTGNDERERGREGAWRPANERRGINNTCTL